MNSTIYSSLLTAAMVASCSFSSSAQTQDTLGIPERTIVITGNKDRAADLIAVLYSREDMHFLDPMAPRFLLLDQQGKIAFGIGGNVKGQLMYDMDGAIDGNGFTTYDIPVPLNPAQRNRLAGDATHSSLFMRLVGRTKLGLLNVYFQSNFTGNNDSYGMTIKQAWVSLGNVTAGYARSSFVDAAAQPPTIDSEGPSGATCTKNLLVRYKANLGHGFTGAISAEVPQSSYTLNSSVAEIAQRCPDLPIYLQYGWNNNSHIRLSALLRNLSYRDLATQHNEWATGWAVQLSGMFTVAKDLTVYYQGAYGKGYGQYINDLSGCDFDLIPSHTPGKMEMPGVMGMLAGVQYNITPKFFVSATYSQARLYDQGTLGPDTYRYGQYVVANGFYNILEDLQVGLEYNWGKRTDVNHMSGHANRISAMVQYNF